MARRLHVVNRQLCLQRRCNELDSAEGREARHAWPGYSKNAIDSMMSQQKIDSKDVLNSTKDREARLLSTR